MFCLNGHLVLKSYTCLKCYDGLLYSHPIMKLNINFLFFVFSFLNGRWFWEWARVGLWFKLWLRENKCRVHHIIESLFYNIPMIDHLHTLSYPGRRSPPQPDTRLPHVRAPNTSLFSNCNSGISNQCFQNETGHKIDDWTGYWF